MLFGEGVVPTIRVPEFDVPAVFPLNITFILLFVMPVIAGEISAMVSFVLVVRLYILNCFVPFGTPDVEVYP